MSRHMTRKAFYEQTAADVESFHCFSPLSHISTKCYLSECKEYEALDCGTHLDSLLLQLTLPPPPPLDTFPVY